MKVRELKAMLRGLNPEDNIELDLLVTKDVKDLHINVGLGGDSPMLKKDSEHVLISCDGAYMTNKEDTHMLLITSERLNRILVKHAEILALTIDALEDCGYTVNKDDL